MSGYGRRQAAAAAGTRIANPNAPPPKSKKRKAPASERDLLAGLAMIAAQQPAQQPGDVVIPNLNGVVDPDSPYMNIDRKYMFGKLLKALKNKTRGSLDPLFDEFRRRLNEAIDFAYTKFNQPLGFNLAKTIEYRIWSVENRFLQEDEEKNFAILTNNNNPFKIVNDELDDVRQKRTNQFKARVGVVPPTYQVPVANSISLTFKWFIIYFQRDYPTIKQMIAQYIADIAARARALGLDDEPDDDVKQDNGADQGGDEEPDPNLNQEDVNRNLVQLGHITAKLWAPTNRQKKYFDDERDKYCNVAAKILAHCRWSSPGMPRAYRRPTADTLYTALDILKDANIITKKSYVGARGRNIRYLEDNMDRADEDGEKDSRMEGLPIRLRRKYNRFEDELRVKRAKMRQNDQLDAEDF